MDGVISGEVAPAGAKVLVSSRVVANPDGKVRESHDRRVLTRNITERVKETEEEIHKGDTTHQVSFISCSFECPVMFRGIPKEVYICYSFKP